VVSISRDVIQIVLCMSVGVSVGILGGFCLKVFARK